MISESGGKVMEKKLCTNLESEDYELHNGGAP